VIGRKDDDAHAVIAVKEIISGIEILPKCGRKRVAPIERFSRRLAEERNSLLAYCVARSSFTMATGPSKETTMFFHPCAL
jgi:hypothetical protein